MQLTYTGPFDEVEVPDLGVVAQGESIDVPDALAGRSPSDDDPGEGLLAQPDNWQPSSRKPSATPVTPQPSPSDDSDEE